MRSFLSVAALAGAIMMVAQTHAEAREWPWCAILVMRDDSAENCGFESEAQCLSYLSGIGGFCQPNPFYRAERREPPRRKPHRQRY